MMSKLGQLIQKALPRQLISPQGFLFVAAVLSLLVAVCHILGWREYTTFLSGNLPLDSHSVLGIVYVLAYFGFVIIVPILVLAAVVFALLLRPWRRG